jgi:hypothetical protein
MKDPEPVGYYGPSTSKYVHPNEKESPGGTQTHKSDGKYSFKFMYVKVNVPHNRPPRA